MCTLSWLLKKDGYEVFFNRDEQHSRKKAIEPSLQHNSHIIMPIDPQGGGTWIASSQSGTTLCLLNNYQKQAAMSQLKTYESRGGLIPLLLEAYDQSDIGQRLDTLDLSPYLAFSLCVFHSDLNTTENTVLVYQWDGHTLKQEVAIQPVISSSIQRERVINSRTELFRKTAGSENNRQKHLAYHASHLPEKGFLSVCMHRDDAQTQSLCHISVNRHSVTFSYIDGAPCENDNWKVTTAGRPAAVSRQAN